MPPKTDGSNIIRIVEGIAGEVEMRVDLVVRFNYGITVPWVSHLADGSVSLVAGPHMLLLRTEVPVRGESMKTTGWFSVRPGQRVSFVLSYQPSHLAPADRADPAALLKETERFWQDWSARC